MVNVVNDTFQSRNEGDYWGFWESIFPLLRPPWSTCIIPPHPTHKRQNRAKVERLWVCSTVRTPNLRPRERAHHRFHQTEPSPRLGLEARFNEIARRRGAFSSKGRKQMRGYDWRSIVKR